jgi:hypothetical protein
VLDENVGLELEAGEDGVHLSQQGLLVSFGSCTILQTHANIVDPFAVGHELVHAPRALVILRRSFIGRGLVRSGRRGGFNRGARDIDEKILHSISGRKEIVQRPWHRGRSGGLCKRWPETKSIVRDYRFWSGQVDKETKQCQAREARLEVIIRYVPHLGL